MYISNIKIQNFRIFQNLELKLNKGLNVFVGENNSGKTAILDAIRYVLDTNSSENITVEEEDFHKDSKNFSIKIIFSGFSNKEAAPFAEYLTYKNNNVKELHVTLSCDREKAGRNRYGFIKRQIKTGEDANGPDLDADVKELLNITFLKPLRDASAELSSGKNSRLARILEGYFNIKEEEFNERGKNIINIVKEHNNKLRIELDRLKNNQENIENKIQTAYLNNLLLDSKQVSLKFIAGKDFQIFKDLLKKLNLLFDNGMAEGRQGLGYQNLLFMAAELLLLKDGEDEPSKTLIIEEPEAHLHPQHQIKFLKFIKDLLGNSDNESFQVFISTHSPNLSSQVPLQKMYICSKDKVFSLREKETGLTEDDYVFLYKFLDVTKSDLFFARGLIFVEGISEQLILPAISKKIQSVALESLGISIINISGKAFARFMRIFKDSQQNERIPIPIACIRDKDEGKNDLRTGLESSLPCYHKVFISEQYNLEYSFLAANKALILQAVLQTYQLSSQETKQKEINLKTDSEIYKLIDKSRGKSEVAFQLSKIIKTDSVIPSYLTDAIKHVCSKMNY